MTKFLASVSTIEEAILAEQLGADIIDLKNPQTGALGAIETKIITEIVTALHPDSRVSATIGDLPLLPEIVIPAIQKTAKTGVDFIKIGLFDLDNLYACLDALSTTLNLADIALIGVMFADQSLNIDYLQDLALCGFVGVMLDTADKSCGSLTSLVTEQTLLSFITEAAHCNLFCGLAGSLRCEDIDTLIQLDPDYLGFRGALCNDSKRIADLNPDNIRTIRNKLDMTNQLTQPCTTTHAH